MPTLSPFRALRYDESAGATPDLIAPPYDVIDEQGRAQLASRSPHNVVHLTLADSPGEAAETLAAWRSEGVLREEAPEGIRSAVVDIPAGWRSDKPHAHSTEVEEREGKTCEYWRPQGDSNPCSHRERVVS